MADPHHNAHENFKYLFTEMKNGQVFSFPNGFFIALCFIPHKRHKAIGLGALT
jgi:hypothetical protein